MCRLWVMMKKSSCDGEASDGPIQSVGTSVDNRELQLQATAMLMGTHPNQSTRRFP